MKVIAILPLVFLSFIVKAQSKKTFDIFSYTAPYGFTLKEDAGKIFFEKIEGSSYCQLYLWPAIATRGNADKNFEKDWNDFATRPYNVAAPETKEIKSFAGWELVMGAARGTYNNIQFVISIATYTKSEITYTIVTVLNDKKYSEAAQSFIASVIPNEKKFVRSNNPDPENNITAINTGTISIGKPITNFDDGWTAKALANYVEVTKGSTEIRLYYIDKALDDAKSNMIGVPEYYWSKYVEPYFTVSKPEKWGGVEYPIIYFMQGNAINKQTGKPCFVAIKIVQSGGARPIVIITPDAGTYRQQFAHPDDLNRMLNYNKFAVTAKDIIGTWNGGGGGGADYYNAYDGSYVTTHAISTSDEFIFSSNGTYSSRYRSANSSGGYTQFGGQDFSGKYFVADWKVTATNRLGGKTTAFNAQLIAVKGGCLLCMADPDEKLIEYTLYKSR